MPEVPVNVSIRKVPSHPDLFEFTISTLALRSQFRLPRSGANKLRILIEKALMNKQNS